MPEIKFKHLVSCSSEDKIHKADNLLKPELYRKWKCATPGEKRASVILQFEKASEIHSIDIGNESSAFVEIFVGKSSDTSNDYQVLLVASSFMSPIESRNETKTNRVRMFGPDKLAQNLKNEKWDCVQIVCSQPFNKNIQYGLSFIKFHSPPDPSNQSTDKPESKEPPLKLGAFKLKEEDDENNKLSVGSWFQKRNENFDSLPVTGAASIRKASSFAAAALASADDSALKILSNTPPTQVPGLKRKHLSDPTDSSPNSQKPFTSTHIDKTKIEFKRFREEAAEKDKPLSSKVVEPNKKTVVKAKPKGKPFHRIMEKVVFVLSGFQNPYRSELRDKALEMGAKYKGDWDNSCTHLVCAFLNTPKYNQVLQQKGRIVKKEWIIECHKNKKLLPWREYMLGKYSKDTTTEEEEESEEESDETNVKGEVKNESETLSLKDTAGVKTTKEVKESENKTPPGTSKANGDLTKSLLEVEEIVVDSEEEDYQADTEADSSSDGDTEDEIRKVVEEQSKKAKLSTKQNENSERSKVKRTLFEQDSSDDETDEENQFEVTAKMDTKDLPLPDLPSFFKGKHFLLYGDFSPEERHKLRRYIIGFSGYLEDYMGDKVKFVITREKWDKNFDEALSENDNLIFVRPQWIFKCGQDCKFVPYQPYIVVPDT